MSELIAVDRMENGLAVCERADRTVLHIPLDQLPPGVREGDCLRRTEQGWEMDPQETGRRRERNRQLLEQLLKRGKEDGS